MLRAQLQRYFAPENRLVAPNWFLRRHFVTSSLGSVIHAAAVTRLVYDDLRELRQAWLDLVPDPAGEILAGGVLEPGNFVQVVVIEPFECRLKCVAHICEIHDP